MRKKKEPKEEFVEVQVNIGPRNEQMIWAIYRNSSAYDEMPYETFREKWLLTVLAEKVWQDSPKTVSAGTDGSLWLELA